MDDQHCYGCGSVITDDEANFILNDVNEEILECPLCGMQHWLIEDTRRILAYIPNSED
jgi:predicted  nucleic acid-binding Zn-ribbon protein